MCSLIRGDITNNNRLFRWKKAGACSFPAVPRGVPFIAFVVSRIHNDVLATKGLDECGHPSLPVWD